MIDPPKIGIFIDLPLIGEPRPSMAEVIRVAKTINREAGVTLLGQINLVLSVAALDDELHEHTNHAGAKVQELLLRTTISKRRLSQLKRVLGRTSLSTHVIFHRRQVLAAIKLVALFGNSIRLR